MSLTEQQQTFLDDFLESLPKLKERVETSTVYSSWDAFFDKAHEEINGESKGAITRLMCELKLKDIGFNLQNGSTFYVQDCKDGGQRIAFSNRNPTCGELRGRILRHHIQRFQEAAPEKTLYELLSDLVKDPETSDIVTVHRNLFINQAKFEGLISSEEGAYCCRLLFEHVFYKKALRLAFGSWTDAGLKISVRFFFEYFLEIQEKFLTLDKTSHEALDRFLGLIQPLHIMKGVAERELGHKLQTEARKLLIQLSINHVISTPHATAALSRAINEFKDNSKKYVEAYKREQKDAPGWAMALLVKILALLPNLAVHLHQRMVKEPREKISFFASSCAAISVEHRAKQMFKTLCAAA